MAEKIYVTKEYLVESQKKLQEILDRLTDIRAEKADAYQNDTNTWHDNFAYEDATRNESMWENEASRLSQTLNNCSVLSNMNLNVPTVVELWTLVKVLQTNLTTATEIERTIGIVPLGAEDIDNGIYNYLAPIITPLMGAKVGDTKRIKLEDELKMKVLDIQRYAALSAASRL